MNSYDDPVKKLSRDKLRDFIQSTVLPIKGPRYTKVLCFPGAEVQGEEALEVKEVYDPLGIPRSNIVGLEYDREKAQRLKEANLGIKVIPISDLEYLATCKERFDVISLDYTGVKGENIQASLQEIATRQLLEAISVLAINSSASRENRETKKFLRGQYKVNHHLQEMGVDINDPNKKWSIGDFIQGYIQSNAWEPDVDMQALRDEFSREVIRILGLGLCAKETFAGEHNDTILCYPGSAKVGQMTQAGLREKGCSDWWAKNLTWYAHENSFFRHVSEMIFPGLPEGESYSCAGTIYYPLIKMYGVTGMERYSYVSNKGTRMELDLYNVKSPKRLLERISEFVSFEEIRGEKIMVVDPRRDQVRFLKNYGNLASELLALMKNMFAPLPERRFLGSSCLRSEDKQICESPIIAEIEDISKKADGPIQQIEAPSNKDPITKQEAIDLLSTGASPKEIEDCFQGFSVGQLRALKAWVTMRNK